MGFGGVRLIDASEEAGILPVRVSVDGPNSSNVRVKLAPRLFTGVRVYRKVEGFLNRSARISDVLVDVPTRVFGETGVRLSRWRSERAG